jgi:hypothetical protein
MKNIISTNGGAFTIATGLVILAGVIAVQSHQALGLWQQELKNEAIDGCAEYSQYSASRVREDVNGEYTATDSYPIAWIFDECMRNKNADYTRTDFSNLTEDTSDDIQITETEEEVATDSATTEVK